MPDDFNRTWIDYTDDVDAEALNDLEDRLEQRVNRAMVFNVKSYGAMGDGIVNDTVAIQAAVTAAVAVGGGVVHFPPGTYSTKQIYLQSGVHLRGAGRGVSMITLNYDGTSRGLISNWDGAAYQTVADASIEGFTLDCLNIVAAYYLGGEAVHILTGPSQHSNISIRNCTIQNTHSAGAYIADCDGVWVESNRFNNCAQEVAGNNVLDISGSIGFGEDAPAVIRNNVIDCDPSVSLNGGICTIDVRGRTIIEGNVINGVTWGGIVCEAAHGQGVWENLISNNYVTRCGIGIFLSGETVPSQPGSRRNTVTGNTVVIGEDLQGGAEQVGIIAQCVSDTAISGNSVRSTGSGIDVRGDTSPSRNVTVSGNAVTVTAPGNGTSLAIRLIQSEQITVSGNTVDFETTNADAGIWCYIVTDLTVTGNTVLNAAVRGIQIWDSTERVTVVGNLVVNPNCSNTALIPGIHVRNTTYALVANNVVRDTRGGSAKMVYGIWPDPAITEGLCFGNSVTGFTSAAYPDITNWTVCTYNDISGGKHRIMAQFPTGAAQVMAVEP